MAGIPELIDPQCGDITRKSSGILHILNIEPKTPSRYLGISVGSCHDFCKYGIRQDVQTNVPSSSLERVTAMQGEGQDMEKTTTSIEGPSNLAVCFVASPVSNSQKHDTPLVTKGKVPLSAKKGDLFSRQISSTIKEVDVSMKFTSDPKPRPGQSRRLSLPMQGYSSSKAYSEISKNTEMGAPPVNSMEVPSSRGRHETRKSKEVARFVKCQKKALAPSRVLSPKFSVKRASTRTAEKIKNLKGVPHLKNQNIVRKTGCKQQSNDDVTVKTLYVVESNGEKKTVYIFESTPEKKTVGQTQNGIHVLSSSSSSEDKRLGSAKNRNHINQLAPSSEKKKLSSTPPRVSASRLSPTVENKMLKRIRCGNHPAQPSVSSMASSKSTHISIASAYNGAQAKNNGMVKSKVECQGRPRLRDGTISTKNKVIPPRKLNFKRGKVVDLKSQTGSPRKLKFKGKCVFDHQNSEDKVGLQSEVSSLRKLKPKQGVDSGSEISKGDANQRTLKEIALDVGEDIVAEVEFGNVVLRHRDMEGKKNVNILINSLIQETASKFIVARKSKVKALVSAFETVISLHDDKSSEAASVP